MITTDNAIALCIDRIVNKTSHCYYQRTVDRAELYEQLITGEEQEDLLKTMFAHCSKEELEKIQHLTQPITGAICNSLNMAFKKALRAQPILKQIDFIGQNVDEKVDLVEEKLAVFNANKDLDHWLINRFHELTFIDPNAWIVIDFGPYDPAKDKPTPYPFVVSSEEAVNFQFVNGIAQWLMVEQEISYVDQVDNKKKEGRKLFIYLPNEALTFTQTSSKGSDKPSSVVLDNNEAIFTGPDGTYNVVRTEHLTGRVPAFRVGYVSDEGADGEIYVSPIHKGAVPYLLKSIKSVAELDLSHHGHVFPQKYEYADACSFEADGACKFSGELQMNCKKCGGTGIPQHRKSSDVIRIKLPKGVDNAELLDLNKFAAYITGPVEIVKLINDYVQELKMSCYKSVFNAETFSKDQVQQTATGVNLDLQNVYDTLSDYAKHVASVWVDTVTIVSSILGYTDSNHKLVYPSDFKLKSVTDLLNDLKSANDSGAPSYVQTEITRDIAAIMYVDRPNEKLKFDKKLELYPFQGKSKDEVLMIINAGLCQKIDAIVYTYFDRICEELDVQSLLDNNTIISLLPDDKLKSQYAAAKQKGMVWFYDLPYEVRKALLYAKAQEYLDTIEAERSGTADFGATPPVDPNNP